MSEGIAFILPSYGHWDYVEIAARTFFAHTPNGYLLLIDDASPDWDQRRIDAMVSTLPAKRTRVHRFEENGGLTRSWNEGLVMAKSLPVDYVVCGNSDIKFSPDWSLGLIDAVRQGYSLIGPLTNAPGVTARGKQDIRRYYPNYTLTDDTEAIANTAAMLQRLRNRQVLESPTGVNGFFLFARRDVYWAQKFDDGHVFNPGKAYRMTRNEDELIGRWRRAGLKFGIALSSFVFHYRTVSRSQKFRKHGWFRRSG